MRSPTRFILTGLAAATLLSGCHSGADKKAKAPEDDSALSGALNDHIMVDPDLNNENQAGAGVSADVGKVDLPPEQRSPQAIAAARQEAAKLVGGTIKTAPAASTKNVASLVENAATAAQVAEEAKAAKTDCASKAQYSMDWANDLPTPLGVYPHGAVQEAAGTDSDGCRLRVVNFATPVSPADVINFYYTRMSAAGYDAHHRMDGTDNVLGGSRGKAAYLIYARKLDNGVTSVDLIASGG